MLATLGYQLRSIDEYVQMLTDEGIDVLVDVRENAWSHKPGFSRAKLEERLDQAGIEYVHAGFAGNPKRLRESADSHAECLKSYEEYLTATPQILEEITALLGKIFGKGMKVCLMCYERHPGDCHRSILVEAWKDRMDETIEVRHLGPDGAPRFTQE